MNDNIGRGRELHATPAVAVVIPCHNAEIHLAETLASVRAQSLSPSELVVVDDGSTDSSREVAARAGARVLQTTTNGGPASARNLGVRSTSADLIAFLDADDLWEPDHVATLADLMTTHPEAGVAFSHVVRFGGRAATDEPLLPAGRPTDARNVLWTANPLTQSASMVRRSVFEAAGGYQEELRFSEDYELWMRLARLAPFVCTHARTVRYRVHEGQASRNKVNMLVGAWALRERWHREEREPPEVTSRLMAQLDADLDSAWHYRDPAPVKAMLAVAERFAPDSDVLVRRWKRRYRWARLPWRIAAWAFDALPAPIRRRVREARVVAPLEEPTTR